jgi:hypothetical protein
MLLPVHEEGSGAISRDIKQKGKARVKIGQWERAVAVIESGVEGIFESKLHA